MTLNYQDRNFLKLKELLKNKYFKSCRKVYKLPKILIFTLLRSVIDEPLNNAIVQFEDELNMREFMDEDFGDYEDSTNYLLYAINILFWKIKKFWTLLFLY